MYPPIDVAMIIPKINGKYVLQEMTREEPRQNIYVHCTYRKTKNHDNDQSQKESKHHASTVSSAVQNGIRSMAC